MSATANAQPAKAPVQAVETAGVTELRNRPAPAPLTPSRTPEDGAAKRPAAPVRSTSAGSAGDEAAAPDARAEPPRVLALGWWAFGVAVLVTLGGLGALASRRRRQRRAREECSALLADSVPLQRTEAEKTVSLETDAAPRSRGSASAPMSERQWLSQPPPSSYKEPTR